MMTEAEQDWRHEAVCRDEDPELFFPVGNSGPALLQIAAAKAVCHRCPVASQCLSWALEHGQDAGVWGGMSAGERRAMKRRSAGAPPAPRGRPGSHVSDALVARVRRVQEEDPHLEAPRIAEILGVTCRSVTRARAVLRQQ